MGIRAQLHADDATISKKIRELSERKVPLIAIVGEREAANATVNLRRLGVSGQEEIAFAQLEEELSSHQNQLAVAH
jgi:threonyl-tRNA synthetase